MYKVDTLLQISLSAALNQSPLYINVINTLEDDNSVEGVEEAKEEERLR